MHHLPSRFSVIRFKFASWALLSLWLLIPSTLGLLIHSTLFSGAKSGNLVLWLNVAIVVLVALLWLLSTGLRCPVCHNRSIVNNGVSRHRNAKRLFGSHRLLVACSVIFRRYFHCPYCGNSIAMKARTRRHSGHHH